MLFDSYYIMCLEINSHELDKSTKLSLVKLSSTSVRQERYFPKMHHALDNASCIGRHGYWFLVTQAVSRKLNLSSNFVAALVSYWYHNWSDVCSSVYKMIGTDHCHQVGYVNSPFTHSITMPAFLIL